MTSFAELQVPWWRVRVSVRGAGLVVFGPGHTRHLYFATHKRRIV